MKINVEGLTEDLRNSSQGLLVGNHQSYLDIVIVASIFPTLFVAKSELAKWPLLGWLSKLGGTIFVDREDAHSGVSCAYQVSRALKDGVNVQVFPESTTGDGSTVKPFKGLFFASAVRAKASVLPLTIKFTSVNGKPTDTRESLDKLCWYGDQDFPSHFWNLLNLESAEISLIINEPFQAERAKRANTLAEIARERIFSSFANEGATQAPVEFAGQSGNQVAPTAGAEENYIAGALLLSFFSSSGPASSALSRRENVIDSAPQSDNR